MAASKKKPPHRAEQAPPARQRGRRWWAVAAIVAIAGLAVWALHRGKAQQDGLGGTPIHALEPESQVFGRYAGSSSCQACHQSEYEHWAQSHHGLAERPIDPKLDQGAFDPPRSFKHGSQTTQVRESGDRFEISSKDLTGNNEPQVVARVLGVDPLRQFLVPAPGGRLQAMEACYDPAKNEWFDVYGNEDRQPGEWGHWTGRGMNWNSMCAACHNTRVRKKYDETDDSYHTSMAQMSVSCEACHGPMKAHVQWQKTYAGKGKAESDRKPLSRDQMLDTCGSCHSRRGELTGDFAPGENFFDHFALNIVDGSDVYYANGMVHDEDYELAAFLGSKMYAAGVRCVDCHDPHSGKTVLTGNALCMKCHTGAYPKAPIIDAAKHTFHKFDSAGSQCINCHMPVTTYMQRHGRHDHGFTTPDPLLTKELAVANACNKCHTDKNADWAIEAADKWYGAKLERPARQRARIIAGARKGDDSARAGLLSIVNDANQSTYWKAAACGLLGRWAGDLSIQSALSGQLSASDPLIRTNAVRALGPLSPDHPDVAASLEKLLQDPARSVRLAAVDALGRSVDPQSPAAREYLHFLENSADQPTGQLQKAMYLLARGQQQDAILHLTKSVKWDARSPALRREMAVAYSAMGRPAQAVEQLEQACELDPANADYSYLLGLAYAESGQPEKTQAALERAVQLDPHHARAWYNLALVRRNLGQTSEALQAFREAEAADPSDPDIPYARATLLLQLGRTDDARAAAQRALQIRSDYAPAQQLLRSVKEP